MNPPRLALITALAGLPAAALAQPFAVTWSSATCGGATSPVQAGPFGLQFVIGEPLGAGPVSAGQYTLSAGFTVILEGGLPPCYPNCDGSTNPPILNVQDFACFLNNFAAAAPYANCDHSTTPPILNVADFSCFLNAFAAGCG